MGSDKKYGTLKGPYTQKAIRARIEALFLDNVGKVITREQILQVSQDPETKKVPENWHQRLSELRTDVGYTILSWRDSKELKVSEYLMPHTKKRVEAARRAQISSVAWATVLSRANDCCEWIDGGIRCGLREGSIDPIGGGTVRLTPDHKKPHSLDPNARHDNPEDWQALCGRHQVTKKNYWDHTTGWLNVLAIVQSASRKEKRAVYDFLKEYFGE